jgi:carbamoyl-phosphate synthase large subunit
MNILLTSVGRRSYLVRYFREALQGGGTVIGANMYANAPGMCEADEAVVVPASHEPTYVDVILDVCRTHNIGMLCSFHDLDVFILGQHRDRIAKAGVIPVLPDPDWARICLDKYECGLRLQKCGWGIPWTSPTLKETKAALADGRIGFPLMVKARLGFGSLGLHRCHSLDELEAMHRKVRAELEDSVLQRFCPLPPDQMVITQEVIDGPECCVDIVNDLQGGYVTHFACRVHAMRAGESDSVTTIDPSFVGDLPQKLSRVTKHPGIWGIDLMVHHGMPKIIDVNPRFTGDYPFQHISGANIPAALLAWARGEEPSPGWFEPKIGVHGYKDLVPTRSVGQNTVAVC